MLEEVRPTFVGFALYLAAVAAVFCLLGIVGAVALNGAPNLLPQENRETSAMEIQLQTARDIRAALSRPIAAPRPLPPITAKLANPHPSVAQIKPDTPEPKALSKTARNALAMEPAEGGAMMLPHRAIPKYSVPDRFAPL